MKYKMKILVIGGGHRKNRTGLISILENLGWEYKFGTSNDIPNFDIIYAPSSPINASKYPNKKFIFGPHFSVFPDGKLHQVHNKFKNSVYIQPSVWVVNSWNNKGAAQFLPIVHFCFPVATEIFKPLTSNSRDKVFIYFKRRKSEELEFLKCELTKRNVHYDIFDYVKRYDENYYLQYLQQAKYGIILDAHESQGFAIEEALSCNVPLLVWSATTMSQEYGSSYEHIPCTSVPYWDERCGEIFYEQKEFVPKFDEFISKIETYKPRDYILENLSTEKCGENLLRLINNF